MALRTFKLMGTAWGDPATPVEFNIRFNNEEVFNGLAASTRVESNTWTTFYDKHQYMCEWVGDDDLIGDIPVSIRVRNGMAFISNIHMNQIMPLTNRVEFSLKTGEGSNWPAAVPADLNEFTTELRIFSDEVFLAKYGADKVTLKAANIVETPVADLSIDENFGDCCYIDNPLVIDSKLNVKINGIPVTPQYNPEFAFLYDDAGKPNVPWTWQIYSGMTLEFDLKITAVPEHV
jgi:hypothetical protein